jgi:phage terminase large subunit-like protein
MKDYAGIATQYARDVVGGHILACKWVRLACQRHLTDLERAAKGWRFDWNPEMVTVEGRAYRPADRVCHFIELLPHIKGEWAAKRENIVLQPWQVFVAASIFGWINKETKRRRFRIADLFVPRKNAKSTLAAGIGLYCLCADGEHGAEVYSGATSEDQAYEVFEPAKLMARKTLELVQRFGLTVRESNLSIADSSSKFEPIIGNPGDGASPSCAIVDEYHEHATEALYDTMRTGMGARGQPLMLVITTAGDNIAGPCYAHQQELQQILDGAIEDDERFGIIYTIDKGLTQSVEDDDDWTSEESLIKANPNWGVSVNPEFMLAQLAAAIRDPRKQATFQTKHLNLWVASASPWLAMEDWKRAGDKTLKAEQFANERWFPGLDLANTTDIASRCQVHTRVINGEQHFYAFWKHYLPGNVIDDPQNKHYQGWEKEGWITRTAGSMIDQDRIFNDLQTDSEKFAPSHVDDKTQAVTHQVALDQWGAPGISGNLEREGWTVVAVPMQVRHLSAPMKFIDGLLKSGRLHHNADPVAAWAVNNVEVKPDHNDNWFPRKQSRFKKTDPAVAMILAMSRAMVAQDDKGIDAWLNSPVAA